MVTRSRFLYGSKIVGWEVSRICKETKLQDRRRKDFCRSRVLLSFVGARAGTGVRGEGCKESRQGGMVARFFHIDMHRMLIEDEVHVKWSSIRVD